jgi:hypothetical protein
MLAGIPVDVELVRERAERLVEPAASTLRDGLERGRATFALTIEEPEQILRGLDDCPDGLAEPRSARPRAQVARARGACLAQRE